MKIKNISLALAATAVLTLITSTGFAQINSNLFRASIRLTCASTNANGNLVYQRENTSDFIQECATESGLTNLTGLSLVYNRSNTSLEVVSGTNQTVVCTPLSFTNGLSITNTNNSVVELQSYVFVDTNTVVSGVLSATERLTYGTSNQLTGFILIGRLNYTEPANGTNSPAICRGTLIVGSAIAGNDDDDEGGNNGNNGHHGEGNNGNGLGNGGPSGNGSNPGNGHNH